MGLRVDQNATSLVTRPEMRFCGHKGHPNVIDRFSTTGSIETIFSFISMGSAVRGNVHISSVALFH